ncbi:hypothetical protein OG215_02815 [Streptomyces globisporus]|uniref:hypothetical protein n=1 Tax=Streptomyces globisporus TaxID=1908 RepID=UPI003867BFBE|nr:hypothetical protein OG215_02815 [Streptomyces globisporus]
MRPASASGHPSASEAGVRRRADPGLPAPRRRPEAGHVPLNSRSRCASIAASASRGPTTYHWNTGEGLSEVCAGGCAPQAGAWTSAWSPVHTAGSGPYKVQGEFGDGSLWDLHASWGAWQTAAEKCTTYTAGKVCARYEVRRYRDTPQERGRIAYTPANGGYVIPIAVGVGSTIDNSTTGRTSLLCQPCTKRTTPYSATTRIRETPNPGGTNEYYATARFEQPDGTTSVLKAAITG